MLPRIFFKTVQFGVYFDPILSLKFFQKYHFLYVRYEIPECLFMFHFLCFFGRLLQRSQSITIYVRYCLSTNVNVSRRFSE